jgi:hypothetical protein
MDWTRRQRESAEREFRRVYRTQYAPGCDSDLDKQLRAKEARITSASTTTGSPQVHSQRRPMTAYQQTFLEDPTPPPGPSGAPAAPDNFRRRFAAEDDSETVYHEVYCTQCHKKPEDKFEPGPGHWRVKSGCITTSAANEHVKKKHAGIVPKNEHDEERILREARVPTDSSDSYKGLGKRSANSAGQPWKVELQRYLAAPMARSLRISSSGGISMSWNIHTLRRLRGTTPGFPDPPPPASESSLEPVT